jgi:selenide,water dikinase
MLLDILADAQTSGGLLISVPEERAQDLADDLRAHDVPCAAIIGRADAASDTGTIEIA